MPDDHWLAGARNAHSNLLAEMPDSKGYHLMTFSAKEYAIRQDLIIEEIKACHRWREDEGFIADGVICPEEFEKQRLRILVVLAESYGYHNSCCVDIREQPYDDLMGLTVATVKTPRRLATVLYLLTSSLERGSKITIPEWQTMPYLLTVQDDCTGILNDTLARVAWINVKKASSPHSHMDPAQVMAHAQRNKDILRHQFQAVAPDLAIICGKEAYSALCHMDLLPAGCDGEQLWKLQHGIPFDVIAVTHPASQQWMGYPGLYDVYTMLFDQLVEDRVGIVNRQGL